MQMQFTKTNIILALMLLLIFVFVPKIEGYADKKNRKGKNKKNKKKKDTNKKSRLATLLSFFTPNPTTSTADVTSSVQEGDWIQTNITYYGQDSNDDNGVGFSGVNLHRLGTQGMSFNGKPVYPVAVHHDEASQWMYKVVELQGSKITPGFLGYVVDICNRKDSSCSNRNKNGLSFLIDIHKTGFQASGNTNNGQDFTTGQVRMVGSIPPKDIPTDYFMKGAKTYMMCGCTGRCEDKDITWNTPDKC